MRVMCSKRTKGSALLTTLIFSFALMVIVTALAYNFRASKLTIDTLINDEINANIDDGYLDDLFVSSNIDQAIDDTIGNFRFLTTVNSITPAFYTKNSNGALYQAEPYLISHNLRHDFINNGVTEYTKNILFNSLPSDTVTQYSDDVYPINVPFVNIDGMTGDLATYKLSSDSTIVDNERGFIGTIQKNGNDLNIVASGTSTTVGVPNDLNTTDYKFNIGWNLKDGLWSIFLAAYDTSKVYTSSTTLRSLVDNSTQAQTDLNNWKDIASLPSGSVVLTKWYHDADDEVPKPVILRKQESAATPGNFLLKAYKTTYDNATSVYTADTAKTIVDTSDDFDVTKVFMIVPEPAFTLDKLNAKRPLIFYKDGGVTKATQFNDDGSGRVLALVNLKYGLFNTDMEKEPVLVRKNAAQMHLIYSEDNYLYFYSYNAGSINGSSQHTQIVSGTIQKLIPKFGALFIVTDSKIYIFDMSTSSVLNDISITSGNYQILRDDDGKIYATADDYVTKHYIREGCSSNGCIAIDELNNISPYLGMVYRDDEH